MFLLCFLTAVPTFFSTWAKLRGTPTSFYSRHHSSRVHINSSYWKTTWKTEPSLQIVPPEDHYSPATMFSSILCCLTEAPGNGEDRSIFSFKVLLHSRKPKQPTSPEDGKKEPSSLFFPKKNDCLIRNNCYPRWVAINTSWPIIFHPLATWKPDMHKQSHVPGGLRIQKRKSSAFCKLLTGCRSHSFQKEIVRVGMDKLKKGALRWLFWHWPLWIRTMPCSWNPSDTTLRVKWQLLEVWKGQSAISVFASDENEYLLFPMGGFTMGYLAVPDGMKPPAHISHFLPRSPSDAAHLLWHSWASAKFEI